MSKNNQKRGYVYVAHAEKTVRYKIGETTNLDQRLYQLNQKQSPYPIVYKNFVYVINAHSVEHFLHRKYITYKVHNEWFEFTENQLNHLLEDMKIFSQMSFDLVDDKFEELVRQLEPLALMIQTAQQKKENTITPSSDTQAHQSTSKPEGWWKEIYGKANIFDNRDSFFYLRLTPLDFAFTRWCRDNSIYDQPVGLTRKRGLSKFQFGFNEANYIAIYLQYLDYVSTSIVCNYLVQYLFAIKIDKKSSFNIQSYVIVFVADNISLASEIYKIIFKFILLLTDDTCMFIGYINGSPGNFTLYAKIGETKN